MVHSERIPNQRSKCQLPWNSDGEWMCNSPNRHCGILSPLPGRSQREPWPYTEEQPAIWPCKAMLQTHRHLCKLISIPIWSLPPLFLFPHVSSPMGGQGLVLEAKCKTLPQPQSCSELLLRGPDEGRVFCKNSVPKTWQGPCSAAVLITFLLMSIT